MFEWCKLTLQRSCFLITMTTTFPQQQPDLSQTGSFGPGEDMMSSLVDGDHRLTHHGWWCQSKAKNFRRRRLHESSLNLGDTAPCYTTTHNQSFSGRSADGRPLTFCLRDPSFPSQHHRTRLDLGGVTTVLRRLLQSHTTDVHGPKHVTARVDLKEQNWARYRSGHAVREVTNPQDQPEYRTSYGTRHTLPATDGSPQPAGGRPTRWHRHDILTGEQRQTDGPGESSRRRRSRDEQLWAARRRETDAFALRLY